MMQATQLPRNIHAPLLLVALALTLSLLVSAPPRAAASVGPTPYHSDQIVVRLAPSASGIADLNQSLGTSTVAQLPDDPNTFLLQTPPGVDSVTLSETLALDPRLEFAEANFVSGVPEANPRRIGAWGGLDPAPLFVQPALSQIRLSQAQRLSRGAGVTVAIIDTGAQLNHPALRGSIALGGYDFVDGDADPTDTPDGIDNDGDGIPDEAYGHGTHVAGIVHTVAPDAKLLILRALTSEGDGDIFNVAEAIDYAVDHDADVINLSLGTSEDSQLLRDAVLRATRADVLVVASAGNEGADIRQYPAASNCVVGVTSVDANDIHSGFANYGGWVGVAAPGESIFNAFPTDGYATWSGTSMAAPFVAGQAALIRSLRPRMTVRDVANLIGGTADSISLLNPGYNGLLGDGRIDLAASVYAAAGDGSPRANRARISSSCFLPR
jgi:subtilisin family serine protease